MLKNSALVLVLMSLLAGCGENNNSSPLTELFVGSVSGEQDGIKACAEYYLTKKEDLPKRDEVKASIDEGRNKIAQTKCAPASIGTCTYTGKFSEVPVLVSVFVNSGDRNQLKAECEKEKGTWK